MSIYGDHPSPFDAAGVQYAWDSTSLGLLKTCPRKYFLSMVQNWQPKRRSYHLEFGILYHSAIERYLKEMALGERTQARHDAAVLSTIRQAMIDSASYDPPERKSEKNEATNPKTRWGLIRSLVWHFEEYGLSDPCETLTLSNGRAAVELSFRFEVDYDLVLAGHLDRLVAFGDGHYVEDHKTTSATVTGASKEKYFAGFNPDNQMTLYSLAASVAFQMPVRGVIIDAAQIAVSFTAFGRDLTHRTPAHLDEFLRGVYAYRQAAEGYTLHGFWPMNETACGNYGGCAFRGICSKSPLVRDRFLPTDFTQEKPWNPLEPR